MNGLMLSCMLNSGQTCIAPTRMLVPRARYEAAVELAQAVVSGLTMGDPAQDQNKLGTVASPVQFERVQTMIELGIAEGARLAAGGPGRPEGLANGFYVRPTLFADVHNHMRIAREEIFGPVLCIIAFDDDEDALRIANDSEYGLAGYVWSSDADRARQLARRLRAGSIQINGCGLGKSGNGREFGRYGMEEFLEYKALMGWSD